MPRWKFSLSDLTPLLVWTAAAGALAWHLTAPSGIVAACAGAIAGSAAVLLLASAPLRLAFLWAAGVLGSLTIAGAVHVLRSSEALSHLLSAGFLYNATESLSWFAWVAIGVALLQVTRQRYPLFAAVEFTCLAAIFVGILAAHRDGFMNRPFFFVDPLWARGRDPLPVLMALGVIVAGLSLFAVAGRRKALRDYGLLALLLALIFILLPAAAIKQLPRLVGSGLGSQDKNGQPRNARGQKGQKGQNGGSSGSNGQDSNGRNEYSFEDQARGGSSSPVAVVNLHDDYDPPYGAYYFRETVFSQFNGRRLVRDTSGAVDQDVSEAFPSPVTKLPTVGSGSALRTTVAMLTDDNRPLALVNAFKLSATPNPDPRRFLRAYDVESQVLRRDMRDLLKRNVGDPGWNTAVWQHYLAVPDDPRYHTLAQQAVSMLPSGLQNLPLAKVAATVELLNKTGIYSLSSRHASAEDPVADFLFGDRTGYCVYFAHSACFLFRTLGIPSRVGAGYAVDARQRGHGSSILIRPSDSHAWPEVFVEGVGWIVFDISPERTLAPPQEPVDSGLQQMMGDMARQSPLNGKDMEPDTPGRPNPPVLRTLAWAILLSLLLAYSIKAWRRLEPHFCSEARTPIVVYRGLLDRLSETGRARLFGETRESFARRNLPLCPALVDMTQLHLRATLGPGPTPNSRGRFLSLYRSASEQLAARVPLWRRIAGLLDPLSWWRVR
jgi:transglutaminase-like putative cysteine protease